jgi:GNAT superfamily N-acetyltransferase
VDWCFTALDNSFDKQDFDCGQPPLDEYLQKYASQNMRKGYGATFVATEPDSKVIAGYYTASATSIEFANIPIDLIKGLPRYPAPAMLIGQLAVNKCYQNQGLGKLLLMHALSRAVRLSGELGLFAVRVDAIDLTARSFYQRYGFVPLIDRDSALLLPIKTITASRR